MQNDALLNLLNYFIFILLLLLLLLLLYYHYYYYYHSTAYPYIGVSLPLLHLGTLG